MTTSLTLAILAPAAMAAERHASPAGTGDACAAAAPCSIQTAFSGSSSGDEIVLAPGDYGSPSARLDSQLIDDWKALDVHGRPGAARPRIWSDSEGGSVVLLSPDSRLSYVDIDNSRVDAPGLWGNLGSVDHVRIESKGLGVSLSNGTNAAVTISNTSIHASTEGGWGISLTNVRGPADFATTLMLRNVTIVDDGPGSPALAITSIGIGAAKVQTTALVSNSILRGTGGDITAYASNAADKAAVVLDHSSFATGATYGNGTASVSAATENANQSTPPAFADAATGDLRQAAGSPTIDAGTADPLAGLTDLEGDARVVGDAIDIGADEYVAPAPPVEDGGSVGPPPGGHGPDTLPADTGTPAPGGEPVPAASGSGAPAAKPPVPVCVVPRLTGKTLAAARAALAKAGCATGKVTRKRAAHKAGKVIAQKARPGTRLARRSKVALVVGARA